MVWPIWRPLFAELTVLPERFRELRRTPLVARAMHRNGLWRAPAGLARRGFEATSNVRTTRDEDYDDYRP